MAQSQQETDDAVLSYALESRVVTALEAETLRTELQRKRTNQKDMTMIALMVYKGIVTREQGDALISRMNAGAPPGPVGPTRATRMLQAKPATPTPTRPIAPVAPRTPTRPIFPAGTPKTLLPDDGGAAPPLPQSFLSTQVGDSPKQGDATLVPDAGDTHAGIKSVDPDEIEEEEEVTSTATAQAAQAADAPDDPVSPVDTVIPSETPPSPSDERITAKVDSARVPEKPTARRTSNVEDSRPTGRSTSKRQTVKAGSGVTIWAYEGAQDELAATDRIVAAGTIIQGSEVTIAQVRHQMGIGEGVKLVSDKMGSTLAHLQPDATAEKKRYVVIREIARGGMGKVLEVEDTELRRSVALKVLRKELLGRRDVVERFLEEAQITGQLEHPNIVPVHEMGVDGAGNLYFTMKYVEGLSLSEVLLKLREGNRDTKRDFPLLKLLDIFIKICEGMAFAHNRGVIHRDLKPANIMVGKFGEVQVMDWGVGKIVGKDLKRATDRIVITDRLEGGSAHTMVGAVIGTPSYMSPEQARGEIDEMGPATDIFSLGIILYEMLALRSPWAGKDADEVLDEVREKMPQKPSLRNPDAEVPAELERLCMKCLAKDAVDRVETAKELADNVRSFIEGRALGAVEYSVFRLAYKWVTRHRKEVFYISMMFILLVGGIVGTLWYLNERELERVEGFIEEARGLLKQSSVLADNGQFDEAERTVDDAAAKFREVLGVDGENGWAIDGLERTKTAIRDIRQRRTVAGDKVSKAQRLAAMNDKAQAAHERARREPYFELSREHLLAAIDATNVVLAEDPDNDRAKDIKAAATSDFVRKALDAGQWDVCDLFLKQLADTGRRTDELAKLRQELQLKRR